MRRHSDLIHDLAHRLSGADGFAAAAAAGGDPAPLLERQIMRMPAPRGSTLAPRARSSSMTGWR
jgi:hypothetical protein